MASMRDRGQMLLVGAIAIAIIFLSLAVVLNGSLHTPSVASQSSSSIAAADALTLNEDVRQTVAWYIRQATTEKDDFGPQEAYVRRNVSQLNDDLRRYEAENDRAVRVEFGNGLRGERSQGTFDDTDASGELMANGNLQRLRITESDSSLSSPYTIRITDDLNDEWEIEFSNAPSVSEDFKITVTYPSGATPQSCFFNTDATVDITNATIESGGTSEYCNALDFWERSIPEYEVEFINTDPDAEEWEYDIIEQDSGGDLLYGATVRVQERGPDFHYIRVIRVAPGEP